MVIQQNIRDLIEKVLPPELAAFLKLAGITGMECGQRVFLVGGGVRDLLLGRLNLDLDLTAEKDAALLAAHLSKRLGAKLQLYSRFNTATLKWESWSADIATARTEVYRHPGALPDITGQADIESDLRRRDFTINAIAAKLTPDCFGDIIDVFKGRQDLKAGLIRVLHDNSFVDDATRIWRAVRYEQRLDFEIEPATLALINKDLGYQGSISADRLRNELELCLDEEKPEKVLARASELGLLSQICPGWKFSVANSRNMVKLRTLIQPCSVPRESSLVILCNELDESSLEGVINRLNPGKAAREALWGNLTFKNNLLELESPTLSNNRLYNLLSSSPLSVLLAQQMIQSSNITARRIELYLTRLSKIMTALKGDDLVQMGIPAGPKVGEILERLKAARLNGEIDSRDAEMEMVKKLARGDYPSDPGQ